MRSWWACGVALVLASNALAADPPPYSVESYGFARLFAKAKADPQWQDTTTLSGRMLLVRACALKEPVVSKPVSDRYMVTCYGGAVDLVHFFALASNLCSGQAELGPRLYQEWLAEGGRENKQGFNHSQPPEAHPDDLPSNALGALFGLELSAHELTGDVDLQVAFEQFAKPLIPVPDAVAREFSHRQIVMGLKLRATRELEESRRAWFTAAPLVQCPVLNAAAQAILGSPLCQNVTDGNQALGLAGLRVVPHEGEPIVIRRLPRPE